MSNPAFRAAYKKLSEDYARVEAAEANAKTEQEAFDVFIRHGIDERNAAIFAGMHGERLAARQAAKRAA